MFITAATCGSSTAMAATPTLHSMAQARTKSDPQAYTKGRACTIYGEV